MAESLGGLYDTPHGIANAILLPYVMEYNFTANLDKFAEIAKAMGEPVEQMSKRDAAYQAVEAVKKLNTDLKIPTLKEIGAKKSDLSELAQRSSVNVSVTSNPRTVDASAFKGIFEKAFCA